MADAQDTSEESARVDLRLNGELLGQAWLDADGTLYLTALASRVVVGIALSGETHVGQLVGDKYVSVANFIPQAELDPGSESEQSN